MRAHFFALSVVLSASCKSPPAPTAGGAATTSAPTPSATAAPVIASASAEAPLPEAGAASDLSVTPIAGELAVGGAPPDFTATTHDGASFTLSKLEGKVVVVYFYPRDETPGCTKEACDFRDAMKKGALSAADVVLFGVSTDSGESHRAFAKHHELPFHLVSDPKGELAKAFGVPNRGGFLARQTFVIGKDGKVRKIYRTVEVSVHSGQIVEDVRSAKR